MNQNDSMHALPFGAFLTRALLEVLRDCNRKCIANQPDFAPSLNWSTFENSEGSVERWCVFAYSRNYMRSSDLFMIDGVGFHVNEADQARAAGRILDWGENGIVEIATPKS